MLSQALAKLRAVPAEFLLMYTHVAIYALCFQMQQPTQLYLVKSLVDEGDKTDAQAQFALIKSFNGALQLVGSLISGYLVDKFGAHFVLILSIAASLLSYGLTAAATSVEWLALAQLPTVLQHAVLAGRALVSIRAADADRAVLLGYVGVAYGVGFILGPVIGGQLASVSLRLPAIVATAVSCLSVAALLFQPAASSGKPKLEPNEAAAAEPAVATAALGESSLSKYRRLFSSPRIAALLLIKLLFAFALALFYGVSQIVMATRFGLDAKGSGYLMSAIGVVGERDSGRGVGSGEDVAFFVHRPSNSCVQGCWLRP